MRKRIEPGQIRINPCGSPRRRRQALKTCVGWILLATLPFLPSCDGGDGRLAEEASENGWEVWLADQSDSTDISAENPTGTYGSRIVIYEGSDVLAAPSGWYAEDDPDYGPTVIEAVDVFPNALDELGLSIRVLHGMLPHPTHRYMNANFFGPGQGMVGIIDAEGQCAELADGSRQCGWIEGAPREAARLAKALFRTTGPEGLRALEPHVLFLSRWHQADSSPILPPSCWNALTTMRRPTPLPSTRRPPSIWSAAAT